MDSFGSNIKPVLLLGVGNILQADDGIGVHVIQQCQSKISFPEVEIIDGGTAGLDLQAVIENRKTVIVVEYCGSPPFSPGSVL